MDIKAQLIKDIEILPESALQMVNAVVRDFTRMYSQSATDQPNDFKLPYGRGCMKGKMKIYDDFDEPLDDFKEYM